jgi:hypothetical protein
VFLADKKNGRKLARYFLKLRAMEAQSTPMSPHFSPRTGYSLLPNLKAVIIEKSPAWAAHQRTNAEKRKKWAEDEKTVTYIP